MLQVALLASRGFTAEEGLSPSAPPVGVISEWLQRVEFDGIGDAVGATRKLTDDNLTEMAFQPFRLNPAEALGD